METPGKYDCPWCGVACNNESARMFHLLEQHVERLMQIAEDAKPKGDANDFERIPAYNS